jgi:hypothetical protein
LFFLPKVNERFCPKCSMPFQDGAMPAPLDTFDKGNIAGRVYPSGGYRKNEVVIRVGRLRAGRDSFYLSEFIPLEDLNDLIDVASTLRTRLTKPRNQRSASVGLRKV